jgi:hypothetical protein
MLGGVKGAALRRATAKARAFWIALAAPILLSFRLAEPLLVQHTLCEHGEFTHVGAEHDAPAEDSSVGDRRGPEKPEKRRVHSGQHDHCDALALRCLSADTPTPVPDALLLLEFEVETARDLSLWSPIPKLHLAPKTSPPRA